ncbi:MAG: signal peptide peptidase SppA [Myxococcota bacterium]
MPELREHERLQLMASTAVARQETGCDRRRCGMTGLAARFASLLATLALATGCITIDLLGGGGDAPLAETVVRGVAGPKILLLDVDGVIDGAPSLPDTLLGASPPSTVARVREVLDRAREDDEVRAVLLRIDSPGGTATASEQVYTEILRFRRERGMPVVAQLLTTAASGGYYVAMAADTVQAHPTTVTGSIGVIFTSLNIAGLMERIGIEDQTITAGEFKDAGSPFRRLTSDEREQLQSIVDDLHDRFREVVEAGRPALGAERVRQLADGRIYSARQALENGLVDRIGTLEDAVAELERRLGVTASRVVAYHRPRESRRNLYTRAPIRGLGARVEWPLESALAPAGMTSTLERILARPGFHYLWWPGLDGAR